MNNIITARPCHSCACIWRGRGLKRQTQYPRLQIQVARSRLPSFIFLLEFARCFTRPRAFFTKPTQSGGLPACFGRSKSLSSHWFYCALPFKLRTPHFALRILYSPSVFFLWPCHGLPVLKDLWCRRSRA